MVSGARRPSRLPSWGKEVLMSFSNYSHVTFAFAFALALGGCANTAEPEPDGDEGGRSYATACGAMSARCADGDASSCEKADAVCTGEAGVDGAPGVSAQMAPGECSTMCCAACTRCANGDDTWCGYCMASCSNLR
jgi:hypothetical protein